MKAFKPMLASPMGVVTFPMLASPKIDGVRAIVIGGVVMSRSLKPIPNKHVQRMFGHLEHFDGELVVGESNHPDVGRTTTSGAMSVEGEPEVTFHVFDHIQYPEQPFQLRHARLTGSEKVVVVKQTAVGHKAELDDFERRALDQGYEGVMLRKPDAPYKFGRSTAREAYLLKVKRFHDDEFEIVGFEERMHNANEATTNELGRTARSTHRENLVARGDLGALVLKFGDTTFNCGTGFSDAERAHIWANRDSLIGAKAKVKYFAHGIKDVPKLPSFLGIRNPIDM